MHITLKCVKYKQLFQLSLAGLYVYLSETCVNESSHHRQTHRRASPSRERNRKTKAIPHHARKHTAVFELENVAHFKKRHVIRASLQDHVWSRRVRFRPHLRWVRILMGFSKEPQMGGWKGTSWSPLTKMRNTSSSSNSYLVMSRWMWKVNDDKVCELLLYFFFDNMIKILDTVLDNFFGSRWIGRNQSWVGLITNLYTVW